MLEYLVTSKVRRRLLVLLWGRSAHGSVGELAAQAAVAFASAHAELKAMERAGLVVSTHEGGKDVYRANPRHPAADALRALVEADTRPALPSSEGDQLVRAHLKSLGAPLRGVEPLEVPADSALETLMAGVRLARRDPVVARSLPLCFWKLRDTLDPKALTQLKAGPEEKHALGFFLELTGELGGDKRLLDLAEHLKDGRMKSRHNFFFAPHATRAHEPSSFPLASKWGFAMNMDLDSFRSLFQKFESV